jgi:hypothetical protein
MEPSTFRADAEVSSRTRLMEGEAETRSGERRAGVTDKATTKQWMGVKSHERGEGKFTRKSFMLEADITLHPPESWLSCLGNIRQF